MFFSTFPASDHVFFSLSPSSLRAEEERLIFFLASSFLRKLFLCKSGQIFRTIEKIFRSDAFVSTLNKLGEMCFVGNFQRRILSTHAHRQFSSLCVAFLCVCVDCAAPLLFSSSSLSLGCSPSARSRQMQKRNLYTWIPFRVEKTVIFVLRLFRVSEFLSTQSSLFF